MIEVPFIVPSFSACADLLVLNLAFFSNLNAAYPGFSGMHIFRQA
jgi:hypothetical protein